MKKYSIVSLFCAICIFANAQQYEFTTYNMANTPIFSTDFFKGIAVKDNNVWVGTNKMGVYRYNGSQWLKTPILQTNDIRQITRSQSDNTIWIAQSGTGSSGGSTNIQGGLLNVLDTNYNSKNFSALYFPGAKPSLPTRALMGVTVTPLGDVFTSHGTQTTSASPNSIIYGGGVGLINSGDTIGKRIYNGLPYKGQPYSGGANVPYYDQILSGIGSSNNEIWVGVHRSCDNGNCGEAYIAKYNLRGEHIGDLTSTNTPILFTNAVNTPVARAIFFDKQNRTWVGLSSGGIAVYDGGNWSVINEINSPFIAGSAVNFHAIAQDDIGRIFIGTTAGLLIFDGKNVNSYDSYSLIDNTNGLPTANVTGIATGDANVKWLTTGAGIVKMEDILSNTIEGSVLNTSFNLLSGKYENNDFQNCVVTLSRNGTILKTKNTSTTGSYLFDSLTTGFFYDIEIKYVGDITVSCKIDDAVAGNKYFQTKLPYDLGLQVKSQLLAVSEQVFIQEWFTSELNQLPTVKPAYNKLNYEDLISTLGQFNVQENNEAIEALVRLLLLSNSFDRLSHHSASMIAMSTDVLVDLGKLAYSNSKIKEKFDELIAELDEIYAGLNPINYALNVLKDHINEWSNVAVRNFMVESFKLIKDDESSPKLKAVILNTYDYILEKANEDTEPTDAENIELFIKNILIEKVTFGAYNSVFIPLTQNSYDKPYSSIKNYFFSNSVENIYNKLYKDSLAIIASAEKQYFKDSSRIVFNRQVNEYIDNVQPYVDGVADILEKSGIGLALSKQLSSISFALSVASVATKANSFYRGVTNISGTYKNTKKIAPVISSRMVNSKVKNNYKPSGLKSSNAFPDYASELQKIKLNIQNNDKENLVLNIPSFYMADSVLNENLKDNAAIVYSYNTTVSDDDSNWVDFINNKYADINVTSLMQREALNFQLLSYLLDTTNTLSGDSILLIVNSIDSLNNKLEPFNDSLQTVLATKEIPALIKLDLIYDNSVDANANIPLKVQVTYLADSIAKDVFLKFNASGGAMATVDSIYIGNVSPGSKNTYTFTVKAPAYDTIFVFSVLASGTNINNGVGSGAIEVKASISAAFTTNTNVSCENEEVTFTPTVSSDNFTYNWSFGNDASPLNAIGKGPHNVKYLSSGIKNAQLIVKNLEDSVSAVKSITVNALPMVPTILQNANVLTSSANSNNQWFKNDTLINGATAKNYTLTSSGKYYVKVTESGCSSSSSPLIITISGIQSVLNISKITISPNPSTGAFTLGTTAKGMYYITNAIGQIIQSIDLRTSSQAEVSGLAPGMYFIKSDAGLINEKIVVVE